MSQLSFADAEYAGKRKKTRREIFLEEMELVVPWRALLQPILLRHEGPHRSER
jgi:IS5 family transposase